MLAKILFVASCLACTNISAAASLTDVEIRWLNAGAPVLAYAKELKLPVDIIVQPIAAGPSDVPLAMGFQDGRCKLVLTMRGNPNTEAILAHVPAEQRTVVIEAMTAHELGHCWRYMQGNLPSLPTGFVEASDNLTESKTHHETQLAISKTRREEGFADLVALAWTQRHHPEQYAEVFAWLEQERHNPPVAGDSHDTLIWIRLAKDASSFETANTPFEQVRSLWNKGLLNDGYNDR
jgi:hypothetical protein